jgi:hypothetical protein
MTTNYGHYMPDLDRRNSSSSTVSRAIDAEELEVPQSPDHLSNFRPSGGLFAVVHFQGARCNVPTTWLKKSQVVAGVLRDSVVLCCALG